MSNRDPFNQRNQSPSMNNPKTGPEANDTFTNKVTDFAGRMKDQAGDAAEKVGEGFEKGRKSTADTLERAASTLRDNAAVLPGGQMTAGIVERVADTVESTGAYLREHDIDDMKADVEKIVRRHPAQSLIAACAVGFLVGRAFRR